MNTYESYLKHEAGNIITIEECMDIYSQLVESISLCTLEDKDEFWNEFIDRAARYTYIRNQWEIMSTEEKMAADDGRTQAHNVVITALNTLVRIVEREGGDASEYIYTIDYADWTEAYKLDANLTTKTATAWYVIFWALGPEDTYNHINLKPVFE